MRARPRRSSTLWRAAMRGAAVLLLALPLAITAGWSTSGHAADLERTGRLARVPADALKVFGQKINQRDLEGKLAPFHGTLISVPSARQLWQVFPYITDTNTFATAIAVRSLDTLRIQRTLDLPYGLQRGAFGGSGEWMSAIDTRGGRLFLRRADVIGSTPGLLVVDLRTLKIDAYDDGRFNGSATAGPDEGNLGGLTYDPHSDAVYGLYGYYTQAPGADLLTLIYRFDLKKRAWDDAPRVVRSCTGPLPSANGGAGFSFPVYVANDKDAYVVCQRAGLSGTVVRLDRSRIMDSSSPEEMAVGPVSLTSLMVDPASGRLFLITLTREIWAFDTKSMSYIGVIGTNASDHGPDDESVGYGLDESSGRLFFLSPTYGLGFAEGRFFPLPQARTDASLRTEGHERIISDDRTHRLFVLPGQDSGRSDHYDLYRVGTPPRPPGRPDPDANTIDRPEQPGITDSRFSASASGYGARVLLAHGLLPVPPSPSAGEFNPVAEALTQRIAWRCGFSDREMVAGRVAKAQLDTYSAAAEAIAVDIDPRTRADIEQPSRCDFTMRDAAGTERFPGLFATAPALKGVVDSSEDTPEDERRFAHYPASCTSSSGQPSRSAEGRDRGRSLGRSTVTCPGSGTRLVARASAGLVGALSVEAAWSEVEVHRDAKGLVSTVTSVAQDVRIGGTVRIAEIRSTSRSYANGRPQRGEMSRHEVVFRGVSIGTALRCVVCSAEAVVDALNQVLAGRGQARSGADAADPTLRRGSPRGALTAVQKPPEKQASDRALLGDFSTEVPGLEIVVYNDNSHWGRARQVYQFAGVSTATTYNIVLQPTGLPPTDGLPGVDTPVGRIDVPGGGPAGPGLDPLPEGPGAGAVPRALLPTPRGVGGIARAVAEGLGVLVRNPREAALMLTAWLLFAAPAVLARRRSLLLAQSAQQGVA